MYDPLNVGRSYEVENKKALETISELNQASQTFNQQKQRTTDMNIFRARMVDEGVTPVYETQPLNL